MKILPADTWKQPEVPDKQMHFDCFEQLNEYCVIHILSFLEYDTWLDLANVSYRLKNLVNNISYPKQEYLEFNFDRSDTFPLAPTTLARMRQTLLHLGQHLKSVKINFNSEIKPPNCDRIVETFVKYLGPNLKTLCISGLILTNENISKFVPILQQIETLKLSALNEDYGPDLTQICVNLKKLRISHDTSFWSISQPWQKLENLSLASCEFDTERMLDELFLNNPQLKRLNIPVYDQSRVFSVIASFLEDLEKLTVYNDGGLGVSSSHISKLLDLRMLRILKLKYIGGPCVDEILHTLTQLRELTHLEISVYISTQNFKPDPSVILNIARNLTNLNYFHLENCDIKETIILDFIKIATHLKKFAYINFEFQPNIDFFSKILEICQNDKRDLELVFSLFSNEAVNLVSLIEIIIRFDF